MNFVLITGYYAAITNKIVEAYSGKIRLTFEINKRNKSGFTLPISEFMAKTIAEVEKTWEALI